MCAAGNMKQLDLQMNNEYETNITRGKKTVVESVERWLLQDIIGITVVMTTTITMCFYSHTSLYQTYGSIICFSICPYLFTLFFAYDTRIFRYS